MILKSFLFLFVHMLTRLQKVLSTAYASLSVFGLCFTFIIGFLIIVTSNLLDPISTYLFKKHYNQHAHLEWIIQGNLQLQRLAHEAIGFGDWSKCTNTVPTTPANEPLGYLDTTDSEHPILQKHTSSNPAQSVHQPIESGSIELGSMSNNTQTADPHDRTSRFNLEGTHNPQGLDPPGQAQNPVAIDESTSINDEVPTKASLTMEEERIKPKQMGDSETTPSAPSPDFEFNCNNSHYQVMKNNATSESGKRD